ncbi:hypothetical protein HC928_02170 [bacterium]|nr:hypothetical protein [bacterium]
MSMLYLATLGQRPQAITVALDALCARFNSDYAGAVILHTEPQHSGIAEAYADLQDCFAQDYPRLTVHWHELQGHGGAPLLDIEDQAGADQYFAAVLEALAHWKREGHALHLMVSGGRKAMSTYATLAATVALPGCRTGCGW